MKLLIAAFTALAVIAGPVPAAQAAATPPPCRDQPNLAVNDYYNPYANMTLTGVQRCAMFVSAGWGQVYTTWLLELTDAKVNQSYPPGGVFFLYAPESGSFGSEGLWWQWRTYPTAPEAIRAQFDIRAPGPYGAPGKNWHHRVDIRYGAVANPQQATVVATVIVPTTTP